MAQGKLIRIEGPHPAQNAHHAGRLADRLSSEKGVEAVRINGPFAMAASAALHSVIRNWRQCISPERQLELWTLAAGETYDREILPRLDAGITVVEDPGLVSVISEASASGVPAGRVSEAVRRNIAPRYLEPDALFCLYNRRPAERGSDTSERTAAYEHFHAAELALRGVAKTSVCADDPMGEIDERIWRVAQKLL